MHRIDIALDMGTKLRKTTWPQRTFALSFVLSCCGRALLVPAPPTPRSSTRTLLFLTTSNFVAKSFAKSAKRPAEDGLCHTTTVTTTGGTGAALAARDAWAHHALVRLLSFAPGGEGGECTLSKKHLDRIDESGKKSFWKWSSTVVPGR